MERRVHDHEVRRRVADPIEHVGDVQAGLDPGDAQSPASRRDRVVRLVAADERDVGVAMGDRRRHDPVAAAEIDHGVPRWHGREMVEQQPGPRVEAAGGEDVGEVEDRDALSSDPGARFDTRGRRE